MRMAARRPLGLQLTPLLASQYSYRYRNPPVRLNELNMRRLAGIHLMPFNSRARDPDGPGSRSKLAVARAPAIGWSARPILTQVTDITTF